MLNSEGVELLQVVDAIARDKNLSREFIFGTIEKAIGTVGKKKYGEEYNLKTEINKKSGKIHLFHVLNVAEDNNLLEINDISLSQAKLINIDAKIGDKIYSKLPDIELGRISAKIARNVITECIKDAEKNKEFNEFINKIGEIVTGIVKRIERHNIVVGLINKSEALLKRDQLLFNDNFKINDRVKSCIQQVIRNNEYQIILSRTDDKMIAKLFAIEVPEIYEGLVQIKAIARDPGSRSKVAVFSTNIAVDPISCCIGQKGSRIRSVINELNGEKIDVVLWSDDIAQFIINALDPITIEKVIINQEKNKVIVVVKKENLSLIVGRKGQNIKLVSKLSGWYIDVTSVEDEAKKRNEEFNFSTKLFTNALDIDETIAQLLVVDGFSAIEQLAVAKIENLLDLGIDAIIAEELKTKAQKYIEDENEKILIELEELGLSQEMLDFLDLPLDQILKLAQNKILLLTDFANLTPELIKELLPEINLDNKELSNLITKAKAQVLHNNNQ